MEAMLPPPVPRPVGRKTNLPRASLIGKLSEPKSPPPSWPRRISSSGRLRRMASGDQSQCRERAAPHQMPGRSLSRPCAPRGLSAPSVQTEDAYFTGMVKPGSAAFQAPPQPPLWAVYIQTPSGQSFLATLTILGLGS